MFNVLSDRIIFNFVICNLTMKVGVEAKNFYRMVLNRIPPSHRNDSYDENDIKQIMKYI